MSSDLLICDRNECTHNLTLCFFFLSVCLVQSLYYYIFSYSEKKQTTLIKDRLNLKKKSSMSKSVFFVVLLKELLLALLLRFCLQNVDNEMKVNVASI